MLHNIIFSRTLKNSLSATPIFTFSSTQTLKMTSYSNSGVEKKFQIPYDTDIKGPSFSGGWTYVQESSMKAEKLVIWVSQVLFPFCITSNTHEFQGPFPRSFVKPDRLKKFFPCLPSRKPRIFEDKSFELGFIEQPNHIFCSSPSTNSESYINWINIVDKKKERPGKSRHLWLDLVVKNWTKV